MKWNRIQELRKELNAERISQGELLEIERAFKRIPQKNLRDLKANAMASDMLDELEARAKKPKEKWEEIDNDAVRHIWKCEDKDCIDQHGEENHAVSPDYYEQNGTPFCSNCDNDMIYVRTEINTNR